MNAELKQILDQLDEQVTITVSQRDLTNAYIALARGATAETDDAKAFSATLSAFARAANR